MNTSLPFVICSLKCVNFVHFPSLCDEMESLLNLFFIMFPVTLATLIYTPCYRVNKGSHFLTLNVQKSWSVCVILKIVETILTLKFIRHAEGRQQIFGLPFRQGHISLRFFKAVFTEASYRRNIPEGFSAKKLWKRRIYWRLMRQEAHIKWFRRDWYHINQSY